MAHWQERSSSISLNCVNICNNIIGTSSYNFSTTMWTKPCNLITSHWWSHQGLQWFTCKYCQVASKDINYYMGLCRLDMFHFPNTVKPTANNIKHQNVCDATKFYSEKIIPINMFRLLRSTMFKMQLRLRIEVFICRGLKITS